jgi:hypothetical protein
MSVGKAAQRGSPMDLAIPCSSFPSAPRQVRPVAPAAGPAPVQPRSSPRGLVACRGASGPPERLVGGDRPDESGELAGDGDDDFLVRLAAAGYPLPAAVQALVGAPGALEHERVLAALARGELLADPGALALVSSRLDQEPAPVAVAGLGGRAPCALLAPLPHARVVRSPRDVTGAPRILGVGLVERE